VIWSEIRGGSDAAVFGRAIPPEAQRQALTVALLGVGAVATGTAVIVLDTGPGLGRVLFETVSAFAAAGTPSPRAPAGELTPATLDQLNVSW
jgi:trk system potassium uptake protein